MGRGEVCGEGWGEKGKGCGRRSKGRGGVRREVGGVWDERVVVCV